MASSWCSIVLKDSIFRVMDTLRSNFTISHLVADKGEQEGTLSPGAPTNSTSLGETGSNELRDSSKGGCAGCFFLNVIC